MNKNSWSEKRDRSKTLLIVEGYHEKEKLMTRLIGAFPEINIKADQIVTYNTNIYVLLSKITEEYGEDWYELDVDLPYLISKDREDKDFKSNYKNVFLIFDYERHDPNFSEGGILKMQEYFSNAEDVGKLYINYPMVESYMDLNSIVDDSYENRTASSLEPNGRRYKNSVRDTMISKLVNFPIKIKDILCSRFCVNPNIADSFIALILDVDNINDIKRHVEICLGNYIKSRDLLTFSFQLEHIISNLGYISCNNSYNVYMRYVFRQILIQNIKKANKIQGGNYGVPDSELKECYYNINGRNVLLQQNLMSAPERSSQISVLNMSILILPDYSTEFAFDCK